MNWVIRVWPEWYIYGKSQGKPTTFETILDKAIEHFNSRFNEIARIRAWF